MRKHLQPPRSKPSAGDHTIAVTKAMVGAIPFIGAAGNELIDQTVSTPAQKRLARWQEEITKTINQLVETVDGITPESLAENEAFLDAVMFTTRIAMVTSRREKIQMLQSVIYRTGSGVVLEEFVRNTFLWIVDKYTPEHIWLLGKLNDPQSIHDAFNGLRASEPSQISISETDIWPGENTKVENLAAYMLPDIDENTARELFTDLHRDSLCRGSEGFAFIVYLQNPDRIVTERGKAFLNFVSVND